MKIYAGERIDKGASVPTKVILNLFANLLNNGYILITDN